MSIDKIYKHYY